MSISSKFDRRILLSARTWLAQKRSRDFLLLMKNKTILPSWLAHTRFPALFARCFCFMIGKFERQLALWLADAITSVFTHEDPTENALRRFPINETVVELRYNAVPRDWKNRLHVLRVRYIKGCPVPHILVHAWLTLISFAFLTWFHSKYSYFITLHPHGPICAVSLSEENWLAYSSLGKRSSVLYLTPFL